MERSSERQWAVEEFGGARLGDARRTARLVTMATEMATDPGGRVSSVFRRSAERQGAYDFLESKHVRADAILRSVVDATNQRAAEFPFVFVPLDGTSLHLTDLSGAKDFGSVGTRERGARGLKIVDAIAVAPTGAPLGLMAMQWWARGERVKVSRRRRSTEEKELQHWLDAVAESCWSNEAHCSEDARVVSDRSRGRRSASTRKARSFIAVVHRSFPIRSSAEHDGCRPSQIRTSSAEASPLPSQPHAAKEGDRVRVARRACARRSAGAPRVRCSPRSERRLADAGQTDETPHRSSHQRRLGTRARQRARDAESQWKNGRSSARLDIADKPSDRHARRHQAGRTWLRATGEMSSRSWRS